MSRRMLTTSNSMSNKELMACKIESLERELEATRAEKDREIERLKGLLKTKSRDVDDKRSSLRAAVMGTRRIANENAELKQEVEELEKTVDSLQISKKRGDERLDRIIGYLEGRYTELSDKYEEQEKTIASLQQEVQVQKERGDFNLHHYIETTRVNDNVTDENKMLRREIQKKDNRIYAMQHDFDQYHKDIDSLNAKYDELSARYDKLSGGASP